MPDRIPASPSAVDTVISVGSAPWNLASKKSVSVTLLQMSATAVITLVAPNMAQAAFIPPPVSAYRLAFVTDDTRNATSSDIAVYDAFVTAQALLAFDLPVATWQAVGSTALVNAITHIDCGATCNALPIYLVDGTLLAASTPSLFTPAAAAFNKNQFGVAVQGFESYVWTGTTNDGSTATGNELGSETPVVGLPDSQDQFHGGRAFHFDSYAIYAISSAIEVPEPASGAALLIGGLIVSRVVRRRRR